MRTSITIQTEEGPVSIEVLENELHIDTGPDRDGLGFRIYLDGVWCDLVPMPQ